MNTKFNIGDTVIDKKGLKRKVVDITIDEFGTWYSVKRYGENVISREPEDSLIKAPITREEALAAALKEIGKRISERVDIELSEDKGCFEVRSSMHHGAYIPMSKEEYHYEED